jgi:hypothetical protein
MSQKKAIGLILSIVIFILLGFRWPLDTLVEDYDTLELQFPQETNYSIRDEEPVFIVSHGIPLPRGEIEIYDYQRGFWGAKFSLTPRAHRLFDRFGGAQISHHTILPHRGDGTQPRLLDLRFEPFNQSLSLVTWRNNLVTSNEGSLRLIITDNTANALGTGIEMVVINQGSQQLLQFFPGVIEEDDGILTRRVEPRMDYSFREVRFGTVPAIEIRIPIGFAQTRNLLTVRIVDFEGNINTLQFVVIYQESS